METTIKPRQALEIIGGLSKPSKMPGFGYGITAFACNVGSKLREVKDSICSKCYALKGFYRYPKAEKALIKRLECITNPQWVEAMVVAIGHYEKSGYFRWHDSGDIQSISHLENICEVAKRLPNIKFWLPTREYALIGQYKLKHGAFPKNLCVRLSAYKINGKPPASIAKAYRVQTSGVKKTGFTCPASKQDNKCLDCRACWDRKIPNVNYKLH